MTTSPAPWRFEHNDHDGNVFAANGYQVTGFDLGGAFFYGGKAEWELEIANGYLIAAAPEMHRELKRCADMLSAIAGDIEDGHSLADLRGKYVTALVTARDDARAIIVKANGAST